MVVLHCKTKGALVAAAMGANVTTFFFDNSYHESGNMNQYANSSYLCFYVSCVNVIVEEAFRTAKVRRSSHHKSASLLSPINFLKKKAANDLLQWPTSPKWHIFAHLLDCSIVPPCADWGSAAIGLSPPEAETWNSLAHALTEFRIGKRILVDDLRSFRRRRSKQATGLDARAPRGKWPAQFMSHWYGKQEQSETA